MLLVVLLVVLLVLGAAGRGDDAAETDGAFDDARDEDSVVTTDGSGTPDDHDPDESETETGTEVESHACQWMATGAGGGGAVHVYSVEPIVLPNDADGQVYADLVRRARSCGDEVTELDLGDEAVGVVDDGSPEVIVRSGDGLLVLRTASDDLGIDELVPLAAAPVGAVEAN